MDERERELIRGIKDRIEAMLLERQATYRSGDPRFSQPSAYWSDFCSYFDYMLGLPEQYFSKLRLHTYHLTGDNYQAYYFNSHQGAFDSAWKDLKRDIPTPYVIYEPEGGIGFRCDGGKLVSHDSMRFQLIINDLHHHDVLAPLSDPGTRRPAIIEIGAGYGGLAHHLSRIIGPSSYFIVDLPETLLFSASYLSLLNPDKRLYLYHPSDFSDAIDPDKMASYDFVLVPNYRLADLASLEFDLAINVASFQEMREAQVRAYLAFISRNCRGVFYSSNRDVQPPNRELSNLSGILETTFDATEITPQPRLATRLRRWIRKALKSPGVAVGLLDADPPQLPPYRHYICRSLQRPEHSMKGGRL